MLVCCVCVSESIAAIISWSLWRPCTWHECVIHVVFSQCSTPQSSLALIEPWCNASKTKHWWWFRYHYTYRFERERESYVRKSILRGLDLRLESNREGEGKRRGGNSECCWSLVPGKCFIHRNQWTSSGTVLGYIFHLTFHTSSFITTCWLKYWHAIDSYRVNKLPRTYTAHIHAHFTSLYKIMSRFQFHDWVWLLVKLQECEQILFMAD